MGFSNGQAASNLPRAITSYYECCDQVITLLIIVRVTIVLMQFSEF